MALVDHALAAQPEDDKQPPIVQSYSITDVEADSQQPAVVDSKPINDAPRTPITQDTNINVTDAFDLQHRAKTAEQQLLVERNRLRQEQEKVRRLRYYEYKYMEALVRCVEDCTQMRNHCQVLASQNLALSHQFERAKLVVQTLEAVIPKMCLSCNGCGCSICYGHLMGKDANIDTA